MFTDEIEVASKIGWSADVADVPTLVEKVEAMPSLQVVKIDRLFTRRNGDDGFYEMRARGIKAFNDAKLYEVPSKIEELAKLEIERTNPWMLNIAAACISSGITEHEDRDKVDGLKRFADVCHAKGVIPCGVSVLTSTTPEMAQLQFGRTVEKQVLFYADRLVDCGFTAMVCSPKEAPLIKAVPKLTVLKLVTPGVRPLGEDVGDQARVTTPEQALADGSDLLIMGRPLTKGVPADNFNRIVQSILAA